MHSQRRRRLRIAPECAAVVLLAVPALAAAQAQGSPFMTGATALQTNILILRCAGSEHGGTSQFAARLIGEREVIRRHTARGREGLFSRGARRSVNVSQQHLIESAVLAAELEQLPDLTGYLKTAAAQEWLRVSFTQAR